MKVVWDQPWAEKSPGLWSAKDTTGCRFSARQVDGAWSWRVRVPGETAALLQGGAATIAAAIVAAETEFGAKLSETAHEHTWCPRSGGSWSSHNEQIRLVVAASGARWSWRVVEVLRGLDEYDAPNPRASSSTLFHGEQSTVEAAKQAAENADAMLVAALRSRLARSVFGP